MTIEQAFDIPFVAALALKEKQIQQNCRPIIAVHNWFARRPGTLFRALALAEFGEGPLRDAYYRPNAFPGRRVADPFMGGGTPLIEANRMGCDCQGFDLNPMSDFCYAWLRRLVGTGAAGFTRPSTRSADELTGNVTEDRNLGHFAAGLAAVFTRMARALKPGAPLAFTYHHNRIETYHAIGVAILDAGLNCTATLPCPAGMGGSIHIHGTGSSIVDTVFVCCTVGRSRRRWLFDSPDELAQVVAEDLAILGATGRVPTAGDTRCIVFGHLTRMGIWRLHPGWDADRPMRDKLARFGEHLTRFGSLEETMGLLATRGVAKPADRSNSQTSSNLPESDDGVPF